MLVELSILLPVIEEIVRSFEWIKTSIIGNHLTYLESPPDLWFQTQEDSSEIIQRMG